MSLAQYRPLGFGEILDGAFSLYRRHFVLFFVTALIPAAPMSLASGYVSFQTMADPTSPPMLGLFVVMVVSAVAVMVQWGALTRHFSQAYTGAPVALGDGFRAGFRALLPLLVVMVLAYLAMVAVLMVMMIPAVILGVIMGATGASDPAAGPGVGMMVMFGVGAAAVLTVMLLLASAMFAVVPAVVVERCGPIAAIARSFRLSRGALLRTAAIVVVGWIVVFLPVVGIGALTGSLAQMATGQPPTSTTMLYVQQIAALLGSALTTPFWVGSLILAYFDRRIRTEALDLHVAVDSLAPA